MKQLIFYFILFLLANIVNYCILSYINYSQTGLSLFRMAGIVLLISCTIKFLKQLKMFKQGRKPIHKREVDHKKIFWQALLSAFLIVVINYWTTEEINGRLLANNYQAVSAEILWCKDSDRYCTYEYEVNGHYYQQTFRNKQRKMKKGDFTEIIYYRKNPNISEVV
ncbi:MAG: hypothetical protein AAFO69_16040, partial [Bacteroidota bacterium]